MVMEEEWGLDNFSSKQARLVPKMTMLLTSAKVKGLSIWASHEKEIGGEAGESNSWVTATSPNDQQVPEQCAFPTFLKAYMTIKGVTWRPQQ